MKKYHHTCVHGRFQPPHKEHLEYIEKALEISEIVTIGITQPNSISLDECEIDPHRSLPSENPLTYEERCACIHAMLLANGVEPSRFNFIPFKIDNPTELIESADKSVTCLTTIRDSWNLKKIEILKSLGFVVEVLWDRRNIAGITGTEIRRKIRLGDESWVDSVHPAVAKLMAELGIIERIRPNI